MAKVTVTSGNSKMGNVLNFSLPTSVCRADAPCHKGCYAKKGVYLYDNVQNCYKSNLAAFLEDKEDFELQIMKQLPLIGIFRWFTSGDIVNIDMLEIMVRLAKKARGVKFLCFTKKYELVNQYIENGGKFPSNLKVVFSGWKGLEVPNPNNLPMAWMHDSNDEDERIPKNALPCGGGCASCMVCWTLKKKQSVVFEKH